MNRPPRMSFLQATRISPSLAFFLFFSNDPLCLVWPDNGLVSCSFRYYSRDGCIRLFIRVPSTFFLSVKIKKCVLIIYKSSADVLFFFGENKKVCVEEWEKKISIVFELLCIIDYIRYLIIIAFIRIRIFYIFEFGFTERDRVSVLFWFPPLFVRAARRDIASSA